MWSHVPWSKKEPPFSYWTFERGVPMNHALKEIASILATGVMRLHLRDVHNVLKLNRKTEKVLEVSSPKSLHRLEPEQRGEKR